VTQPSQVRYVEYFATVLGSYLTKEPSFHPVVVQIDQIVMYGMPKSSFVGYIKPFVELYDVRERKLRHTTKRVDEQPPKFLRQFLGEEVIPIDLSKTVMSGDILVRVHDFGSLINLTPVIIIFPRYVKIKIDMQIWI